VDHHLERMDTLDLVNYEMWRKYRQGDYKALDALSKIAETQIILSQYYDASKMVMENEIDRINKEVGKPRKVTMDEDGELYWDDGSEGLPPPID
jgi:alpha-L-arabinofuranosidase